MKHRLSASLTVAAAAAIVMLTLAPAAFSWSPDSLPLGFSTRHIFDTARGSTCPEAYRIFGPGGSGSGPLCTRSSTFQQDLNAFVNANIPTAPLTFVLAGQSNMVGYGPLPATPAPANPMVTVDIDGDWQPLTEPLNDGPKIAAGYGSGPAVSFADEMVSRTGRAVQLIPCAYPGSFLSDWQPGGWLYARCVQRVGAQHVDGMIFLQGEQDATDAGLASTWAARFGQFTSAIRSDLGQSFPIVFAQIAAYSDPAFPAWGLVQSQQASFVGSDVSMITTTDLPTQPNSLHFSLESYRALGTRFADKWLDQARAALAHRVTASDASDAAQVALARAREGGATIAAAAAIARGTAMNVIYGLGDFA